MNLPPPSLSFIQRELHEGFLAPINSLRFLRHHKFLLVIGLAPHLAGIAGFFWFLSTHAMGYAQKQLSGLSANLNPVFFQFALAVLVYLLGTLLYSILVMPLISTLASPLFDVIAASAYQETSGYVLPRTRFSEVVRSFLSECSKCILILGVFILGCFLPILAPLLFLASIWFFGWDHMDRTLSLMGFGLGKRLAFGFKHVLACVCLGIWAYVPFAGTVLSFVMSAAGALAVARIQSPRDVGHLKQKQPVPEEIPISK